MNRATERDRDGSRGGHISCTPDQTSQYKPSATLLGCLQRSGYGTQSRLTRQRQAADGSVIQTRRVITALLEARMG